MRGFGGLPWLLTIVPTAVGDITEYWCSEWEFQLATHQQLALAWCQNGGTCRITVNDAMELYTLDCACPTGFTLPDCSFQLPNVAATVRNPLNTLNNTSLVEDLMQIFQAKNDPSYGRYIT